MKGRISEYVSLSLLQKLSNTYFISEFYFQNVFIMMTFLKITEHLIELETL